MNRARGLVQRSWNLARRSLEISSTNFFACQVYQAQHTLCQQTGLEIRNTLRTAPLTGFQTNAWCGAQFFQSICRLMSTDCKSPPEDKTDQIVKKPAPVGGNNLIMHERQVRQNFHEKCVDQINAQINGELLAAYTYIAMASFCSQDNVALEGFAKLFTNSYREEIEHMEKFVAYLNKRGGQLRLIEIGPPAMHEWRQAEDLVTHALEMEKCLNQQLLQLHACAVQHSDAHFTDFLEEHYLQEQVEAIKALADLLTTLKRAKYDLGVHLVSRQLLVDGFTGHGKGK